MTPINVPTFHYQHQHHYQHQQPQQQQQTENLERRRKHGYLQVEEPQCIMNQTHLRYNNMKPSYAPPYTRVPERLYPDPSSSGGWKFTGSSEKEKAEFYDMESDRGLVQLNFYYTSGTIKVVLMHDVDGEVQLFKKGRSLLPDIYKLVLQDPITYTDTKYRRRS